MEIKYIKLSNQHLGYLTDLLKVYEDVFEMRDFKRPDSHYLSSLLSDNTVFFYVALADNKVVGGLTGYFLPSVYLPYYEVYIYDLAITTQYQRKCIGRGLISSLKEYCYKLNVKEIFVQADLEDQHAINFYKATGGNPESAVHFSYDLTEPSNKSA